MTTTLITGNTYPVKDKLMQRHSGKGLYAFIRENRALIDECINRVTSGEKQAHYLKYGCHLWPLALAHFGTAVHLHPQDLAALLVCVAAWLLTWRIIRRIPKR